MLNKLSPIKGSKKKRRRVGRGPGSSGKTSGRGHKGQGSRSGGKVSAWFEGGQTPLKLRTPKRGFKNKFKEAYDIVKISDLSIFEEGQTITPEDLISTGLASGKNKIKLLADGNISSQITIQVNASSRAATQKIENAGGNVEII